MFYSTIYPLILCLFPLHYFSYTFPWIQIFPFAGWLAYTTQNSKLNRSLWLSFTCGVITDLSCTDLPLGVFSGIFCLTTLIVKRFQNYFSSEIISSLCLYVSLYSSINYLIFQTSLFFITAQNSFTFLSTATALFICPIFDTLFFLTFVYYPISLTKIIFHTKNIALCKRKVKEKKHIFAKTMQTFFKRIYAGRSKTAP